VCCATDQHRSDVEWGAHLIAQLLKRSDYVCPNNAKGTKRRYQNADATEGRRVWSPGFSRSDVLLPEIL
jgi:hypothetical protein